ncbi:hypothetical protein ATCC90586_004220 [Pythium insidiosum]|nr:hypothetical protein ATCC90586_004220 [Pythium insidiosum]
MPAKRQPGHRQRGAGTVTVSRGEIVRQGVTLKEWQRTPMQVLHEYCQSKKRQNPRYVHARAPEGRTRMRCILPDDKSSAKDLAFCPEQSFETVEEAKHCAALLALRHLDPRQPLERKLPDPFRDLWLALTKDDAPAAPAPSEAKKAGARGSKGKRDSAQPNSKKAAAAAEESSAVAAAEKKVEDPTSAAVEDDGMDLWAAAGPDATADDDKSGKPTLPMELTADRKFASRAEYEKFQLERAKRRNDRQRSRENRERANPIKTVFMSAACREMIEGVLKQLGVVNDKDAAPADAIDDMQEERTSASATTASDHKALYDRVSRQLASIGFQDKQIQDAFRACGRERVADDDELMTLILDWLCLHVPEGELPKGFNPEGTQLDAVVVAQPSASTSSPLATVLVQRLMKFGYDRRDAVSLVDQYLASSATLDARDDSPSSAVVFGAVRVAFKELLRHLQLTDAAAPTEMDEEERLQSRQDELFALEAIYEDRVSIDTTANGDQWISLQLADNSAQLDVLLAHDSLYPSEFPVLAVSAKATDDAASEIPTPRLLQACATALQTCQSSLGDPMIYDLCVAIEGVLTDASAPSQRIVLLSHDKPSPVAPSSSSSSQPPSTTKTTEKKKQGSSSKSTGRSSKKTSSRPTTKPKIDHEQIQRLSDSLLQRRRAKDGDASFQQMQRARRQLPAAAERENVLQYLVHHQVVLVCGQTGCGKTTQVPQFILDDYIDSGRGGECSIICTQPRRIAAIGVATRVAQERCEQIADVVGYQIRMDAKRSAATRLLFCTTGVLLRRLLTDRQLTGITHVIVDEVHERNVDTDFLLSVLRDLLPLRPDLRVILMSATMNAQLFIDYFSVPSRAPCPVLDIPGFTFPVDCHFLEDVVSMTSYEIPKKLLTKGSSAQRSSDGDDSARQKDKRLSELTPQELVERMDDSKIDYELCVHLIRHLVTTAGAQETKKTGAILVFLPGTAEIKRLIDMLSQAKDLGHRVWALPLHGSLSGADQAQVFRSPPAGKIKVIASTNIAETSITINDITAVIDCGKVKEMVYDAQLRRSQLLDCWASQAACDQRKGRAGRVQAGECFRLFSRRRFTAMAPQLAAEIHRVSLEQLCLQIKKLELGSIRSFLAKAIEPPSPTAIDAAVHELLAIAAFQRVESSVEDVRLTPLGSHLAMLPLDARIGKFLIYGSILRCLDPVASIAACISSKTPFVLSLSDPELQQRQAALKKELNGSSKSDHLLLARLLDRYLADAAAQTRPGASQQRAKRAFCKEFGLSYDTMETIVELKAQYLQQLDAIGFYDAARRDELNENATAPRVVKAALCAGLYDNVIHVVFPEQRYFQAAHGVVTEDHDAKQIRYFVRRRDAAAQASDAPQTNRERVFLHPSSCNFVQSQYDSPWLLYTELVQTSKLFVRESSMVNPYALLLFGGALEVAHEKNLLVLDGWIRFQAVARIGVLIKAMRRQLDALLTRKIADPALDISQSELVTAMSHLLKSEGM